jgi:hypothetical protein
MEDTFIHDLNGQTCMCKVSKVISGRDFESQHSLNVDFLLRTVSAPVIVTLCSIEGHQGFT